MKATQAIVISVVVLAVGLKFLAGSAFAQTVDPGTVLRADGEFFKFDQCSAESALPWDFSEHPIKRVDVSYFYSQDVCQKWNPEFANNGFRCCAYYVPTRRKTKNRCSPERRKFSFCSEMTAEQRTYREDVLSGRTPDVLTHIFDRYGAAGSQAYCSVNNGFIAYGKQIIPTHLNRVMVRSLERCVDFGTDGMIGMLEWTGRQVAKRYASEEFSQVKMIVGDISAPRGGCLSGRYGRRGHASHTNGLDADIGFLTAKAGKHSPVELHRQFDPEVNWWFLKQIFSNPFACVKVVFLDKKLIKKLEKVAKGDDDWQKLKSFVRHMPSHKNHFHIRIGLQPGGNGTWGCGFNPELEEEESVGESEESDEVSDLEGGELSPEISGEISGEQEDELDLTPDQGAGSSSSNLSGEQSGMLKQPNIDGANTKKADQVIKKSVKARSRPKETSKSFDDGPFEVDHFSKKIKLAPVPMWVPYETQPK